MGKGGRGGWSSPTCPCWLGIGTGNLRRYHLWSCMHEVIASKSVTHEDFSHHMLQTEYRALVECAVLFISFFHLEKVCNNWNICQHPDKILDRGSKLVIIFDIRFFIVGILQERKFGFVTFVNYLAAHRSKEVFRSLQLLQFLSN